MGKLLPVSSKAIWHLNLRETIIRKLCQLKVLNFSIPVEWDERCQAFSMHELARKYEALYEELSVIDRSSASPRDGPGCGSRDRPATRPRHDPRMIGR